MTIKTVLKITLIMIKFPNVPANAMLMKRKKMTETKERVLQVADRCDRCNAQAFVLVKGLAGELMFCAHHYTKHEDSLVKYAYEIIDERSLINKKSESSA
jgi:uncharacterized membrane protein